jgi:hypothetical protein
MTRGLRVRDDRIHGDDAGAGPGAILVSDAPSRRPIRQTPCTAKAVTGPGSCTLPSARASGKTCRNHMKRYYRNDKRTF